MPDYLLPDGRVPVLVSALTADLVRDEAAALLAYATAHPAVSPQAIAGMLFRTRTARPHRALAMATGRTELLAALTAIADGLEHPAVVRPGAPATTRRVAYVCPGQGGQRPGMGRTFYDFVAAFRAEADRCAEAFSYCGASPLDYLLDEGHPATDAAGVIQPVLFTQLAGFAAMWRSFGVQPTVIVGHSQGEIAAAYLTGAMTLSDAVRVIAVRAAAADGLGGADYAMAMVAADVGTCTDLLAGCGGFAEVSVVNSPGLTGISGERRAVQDVVDTLTARDVFARVIGVDYPAHTSLIDGLAEPVLTGLGDVTFGEPTIPCLGGTLGGPITGELPADEYWFANLRNTVRFDAAIAAAAALEIDTYVELSAHPTLQLAIGENLTGGALVVGTSERGATDLGILTENLALLAVNDADYRWDCLRFAAPGPIPLPLADFPNTRMDEAPFCLPYIGGPAVVESTPEPVAPATGRPQLLEEQWVRLTRRTMLSPRSVNVIDHTGACPELAAALSGAAAALGASGEADTQVILLPPAPQPGNADTGVAAARAVANFFTDRAWWPDLSASVTDCWLVTVGGEAVLGGDAAPDPVHAGISAGFRCIGTEHPGVRFRHLDLPPGPTPAIAAILSALHTADEPELALRDGGLYTKRMVAGQPPAGEMGTPEHVLILGGTGNLGLEFCEHFVGRGARRITLVSRSGETGTVAKRLEQLRSTARIDVEQCDIVDPAQVARLALGYGDTPADLIIHTALGYADAELAQITLATADNVLGAKVIGIERILRAFPRAADCRVVLCSSAAATIGGRGQILYAAANRMLDAMAHRLRADGVDCVSVQWGQWAVQFDLGEAGWAKLAATGLLPMRPADAIAVGLAPLRGNVAVVGFDLARARPLLAGYGYGPLLSELAAPVEAAPAADGVDLEQRLVQLLAGAIGADPAAVIDRQAPMVAIGLDSLQALEFSRRVKAELNHDLAVADLLGGASIADVLARLALPVLAPIPVDGEVRCTPGSRE